MARFLVAFLPQPAAFLPRGRRAVIAVAINCDQLLMARFLVAFLPRPAAF